MKFVLPTLIMLFSISTWGQDNIALVGTNVELSSNSKIRLMEGEFEATFELLDRIILIEAEVDGQVGKFILDTGSPMLMLNQKPKNEESEIGGISKNCAAELVEIEKFTWAGISKNHIQAMAFDMSNLEEVIGSKISGLIGQNVFGNFEIYIDIPNQKIKLFKSRKSKLHKNQKFQEKISFTLEKHIPVITVKIDGKKYRFGIDTGAEVNVLNKDLKKKFEANILNQISENHLHGIDGESQNVESGVISKFKIKRKEYLDFNFMLVDLSSLEKEFDLELDGILGFPFLKENILSINYKKKKIYFW